MGNRGNHLTKTKMVLCAIWTSILLAGLEAVLTFCLQVGVYLAESTFIGPVGQVKGVSTFEGILGDVLLQFVVQFVFGVFLIKTCLILVATSLRWSSSARTLGILNSCATVIEILLVFAINGMPSSFVYLARPFYQNGDLFWLLMACISPWLVARIPGSLIPIVIRKREGKH